MVFMFGYIVNYFQEQIFYNVVKVGCIYMVWFFVNEWCGFVCVNSIFFGYIDMGLLDFID